MAFALALLIPLSSFATNETVTVNVQSETGSAFSGEWTLYEGSNDSGTVFWNGNASETFDVNEGTYFLKVFPLGIAYPYVAVKSRNPQTVSTDGTVTFEIQYFKTENDMIIQTGGNIDVVTTPLIPGTNNYTEVIIDEFGCNRTESEAWCQRFNECIRWWNPWCKITPDVRVTENENASPTPSTTSSSPTTTSSSSTSSVPSFSTPVSSPATTSGEYELAATGPAGLIGMLLPAMLGSLWITRRKD